MKVIYKSDIPSPLLEIIKPRIETILDYFPPWCYELIVHYESGNTDTTASCKPNYHYRYVDLYIYDYWFSDDEDWEFILLHEIFHALLSPYTTLSERLANLIGDDNFRKYIQQELADTEEFISQDLADFATKLKLKYSLTKPKN